MHEFINSLKVGYFIAVRQVRRTSRWMTGLTIAVMMLTFLNLVATSGFLVGIIVGAERLFKEEWTGDVMITKLDNETDIKETGDIVRTLNALPTMSSYSSRYVRSGTVEANWQEKEEEKDANIVGAQIAGIDPEREEKTTGLSRVVSEGRWLDPDDSSGIVVGSALLQEYSPVADLVSLLRDVHVGTRLRVTVGSSTQEFTVRGIVDSKVDFVSNRIFMNDAMLRRMVNKNDYNATEIAITTIPGSDPYLIKSPLMRNGYGESARINTSSEGAPAFLVNLKLFFGIIGTVLGSVSVVVALITIFIIIYISALTRRKQIGILKGIGVSPLALECSYIIQALVYVFIGSVISLLVIFLVLKPYLDANPIVTPFANIVLVAEPGSVFIKWVLVIAISTLAGYLPARLIVKQNTLNAILGRQ